MPHRSFKRFLAGAVICCIAFLFGMYNAAPKMMCGGVLVAFGSIYWIDGFFKLSGESTRCRMVAAGFVLITGVVIVLFSSDWSAAGSCEAVICFEVMTQSDGVPLVGETVCIMNGSESKVSVLSNARGFAVCAVRVPYKVRYRLIGNKGSVNLDLLKVMTESGAVYSVSDLVGKTSINMTESGGAVFVHVRLYCQPVVSAVSAERVMKE